MDKSFKSRVMYKLLCQHCQACYVGQTDQHLVKRFKQHFQPSQLFGKHIRLCGASPMFEDKKDVSVLHITTRSIPFLEALEAFWIQEIWNFKWKGLIWLKLSCLKCQIEIHSNLQQIVINLQAKIQLASPWKTLWVELIMGFCPGQFLSYFPFAFRK